MKLTLLNLMTGYVESTPSYNTIQFFHLSSSASHATHTSPHQNPTLRLYHLHLNQCLTHTNRTFFSESVQQICGPVHTTHTSVFQSADSIHTHRFLSLSKPHCGQCGQCKCCCPGTGYGQNVFGCP